MEPEYGNHSGHFVFVVALESGTGNSLEVGSLEEVEVGKCDEAKEGPLITSLFSQIFSPLSIGMGSFKF